MTTDLTPAANNPAFSHLFGFVVRSNILFSLNKMSMNGDDGLRALARLCNINPKLRKEPMVEAIEATIVAYLAAVQAWADSWEFMVGRMEQVRIEAIPADTAALAIEATPAAEEAPTAEEPKKPTRNNNTTIRPAADVAQALSDDVWALLSRKEGASTNDLCALICPAGKVQPGTVVSRLGTQKSKGMVKSKQVTEQKTGRTIAFWFATPRWSQAAMAKDFLKIK